MLTLYVGILPIFVMSMVRLEGQLENNFARLLSLAAGTTLLHVGLRQLRYEPKVAEEELEGYDEDFQLLGLS